jgi:exopolysaccharide biosynthesis protein
MKHAITAQVLVLAVSSVLLAEFPSTQPWEEVRYQELSRENPMVRMFVVTVDLNDPDVELRVVPGGPDPDGEGPFQTQLLTVEEIARRDGFDIAINGDFFATETVVDPETGKKKGYFTGQSARVIGPAMTDGSLWSDGPTTRPLLAWTRDRKALVGAWQALPADAVQVISGNVVLLRDGQIVPHKDEARHPRTVVGVNSTGDRLILLTVDGRRPGVSIGMSYQELAETMLELGAYQAVNLDGGGSTTLIMRDPEDGSFDTINQPSDGKLRPVANVLGIKIKRN